MATTDKSQSHIQRVLSAFHQFVSLYEGAAWLKNATTENIISAFRCASFIEETVKRTQENEIADDLIGALHTWWEEAKERTKVYDVVFFRSACDRLLGRFFESGSASGDCTDIAVKIYTKMTSRERLEIALKEIMLKSASFEAILERSIQNDDIDTKIVNGTNMSKSKNVTTNKSKKQSGNLDSVTNHFTETIQVKLLYNNWLDEYSKGERVLIENHIDSMLSYYKLENSLFLLVSILSLDSLNLQRIIVKKLEPKMLDRSGLSKKFWTALFAGVNIETMLKACVINNEFLCLFFDFVEYLVTMVNLVNDTFVVDSNVDCIDITYYKISVVIRAFYNEQKLRDYVAGRIIEAKNKIGTPVWENFEETLILCK